MFFILSKTVAFLLLPSNFLIALGLAGVLLMATRWRRAGVRMAVTSLVLLAIAASCPIGDLLIHPLENRFPPWDVQPRRAGRNYRAGRSTSRQVFHATTARPCVGSDGARIVAMAKLARAYPDARIVYSGGDASLLGNQPPEARFRLRLCSIASALRASA